MCLGDLSCLLWFKAGFLREVPRLSDFPCPSPHNHPHPHPLIKTFIYEDNGKFASSWQHFKRPQVLDCLWVHTGLCPGLTDLVPGQPRPSGHSHRSSRVCWNITLHLLLMSGSWPLVIKFLRSILILLLNSWNLQSLCTPHQNS